MRLRRFFLLSLGLAILSVGLDMTAMALYKRGGGIQARSVVLPEAERGAAKSEAHAYRTAGTVISVAGLSLALASLVFVVISAAKHEPAWRSATIVVLVFYVMLQFALT